MSSRHIFLEKIQNFTLAKNRKLAAEDSPFLHTSENCFIIHCWTSKPNSPTCFQSLAFATANCVWAKFPHGKWIDDSDSFDRKFSLKTFSYLCAVLALLLVWTSCCGVESAKTKGKEEEGCDFKNDVMNVWLCCGGWLAEKLEIVCVDYERHVEKTVS